MRGAKKLFDMAEEENGKTRCHWARTDPLLIDYHDQEWGRPNHNDRYFFEMLCLESLQAGLSWRTVLNKRPSYQKYFCNFEPSKVALIPDHLLESCAHNRALIRHFGKTFALKNNARVFCDLQKEYGTFGAYVWAFVGDAPIKNFWKTAKDIPAKTSQSSALSIDLKKRGMTFIGPTIAYAFMQATGMVNDHEPECFLNKNF